MAASQCKIPLTRHQLCSPPLTRGHEIRVISAQIKFLGGTAETPRLDDLAAEGMRFLNFNVETQCTPSRSALMTGRHPIRSGTTKVVWGQLYGMTQWEITIAELLSEQGYATGMFGKWHLGDTEGRFPTDQGFDEWYGIPNTTDESLYVDGFQFDPEVSTSPTSCKV